MGFTTNITNRKTSVIAQTITEIWSMSDLPAPIGGIITLTQSGLYLFKQSLIFSDRIEVSAGITALFKQDDAFIITTTYSGTSTFITGLGNNTIRIIDMRLRFTGANATGFSVNDGSLGFDNCSVGGLSTGLTLGSITGGVSTSTATSRFIARACDFFGYDNGFIVKNALANSIREVLFAPNSGSTGTTLTLENSQGFSTVETIALSVNNAPLSNLFDIRPVIEGVTNVIGVNNVGDGTNNFFKSGSLGSFTAVANASIGLTSITSVTDSSGKARFNHSGTDVFINQKVIISGYITNTSYNGINLVTSSGVGFFEVNIPFGTNEAGGLYSSNSITITETATPLNNGDSILLDTDGSTDYDLGSYVYNKQTNTFQANAIFTTTATGTYNTGSLDQNSKYVDIALSGAQESSMNIGSVFRSGNVATTSITGPGTYDPINISGGDEGQANSRFKLINTSTGEMQYTGLNRIEANMEASISANKSGGTVDYKFRFFKTSGTGPAFDAITLPISVGTNTQAVPLISSGVFDPGDRFRVEVESQIGSTAITITDFSMVIG